MKLMAPRVFYTIPLVGILATLIAIQPYSAGRNHVSNEQLVHDKSYLVKVISEKKLTVKYLNDQLIELHRRLVEIGSHTRYDRNGVPDPKTSISYLNPKAVQVALKYDRLLNIYIPLTAQLMSDAGWLKIKADDTSTNGSSLVLEAHKLAPNIAKLTLRAAAVHYSRFVESDPKTRHQLESTEKLAKEALRQKPDSPFAHWLLAMVAASKDKKDDYVRNMHYFVQHFKELNLSFFHYDKGTILQLKKAYERILSQLDHQD